MFCKKLNCTNPKKLIILKDFFLKSFFVVHGNVQYGRILFSEKVILSMEGECTFLTC